MTRQEHLLTIAAEECAEVAQRLAKALRFGLLQVQEDADDKPDENPDHDNNCVRILKEFVDLVAVLNMAGILMVDKDWRVPVNAVLIDIKQAKVERYLERSQRCGTLGEAGSLNVPAPPEQEPKP